MAQVFSPTTFALGWLSEGNDYTHAAIGAITDLVSKAWRFGIDALNPRNPDFTPRRSGEGVKQALRDVADQLDYESLDFPSIKLGFRVSGLCKKPPSHLNSYYRI